MRTPNRVIKDFANTHKAEILSGIIIATATVIVMQSNVIRVQRDILNRSVVLDYIEQISRTETV